MSAEYHLLALPGDSVSCLRFSPKSNLLLVSSWDKTARVYDASNNIPKATFNFKAACLACTLRDDETGYAAGLDTTVRALDLERGVDSHLGSHGNAVSALEWSSFNNTLISGSWDSTCAVWDDRSSSAKVSEISTPAKIFSLSTRNEKLVIATSGRDILIYDLRKLAEPQEIRESPLKHQIRKVSCFPDAAGWAIGSIEGRVAIEYFVSEEPDPSNSKNYAFKCHRKGELAYPVSAIAYHPVYGTFATGGGDGIVNIWDGRNRKRLSQLPQYSTSISSLDFNYDGSLLAIAASYNFDQGDIEHPEDNIVIHSVSDSEVKPRPKVA